MQPLVNSKVMSPRSLSPLVSPVKFDQVNVSRTQKSPIHQYENQINQINQVNQISQIGQTLEGKKN